MHILDKIKENVEIPNIKEMLKDFNNHNNLKPKERDLLEKCTDDQKLATKICLRYIALNKLTKYTLQNSKVNLQKEIFQSETFYLPDGFTLEESYSAISYLFQKVSNEQNIDITTPECVNEVRKLLPSYGFKILTNRTLYHSLNEDKYSSWPVIEDFKYEDVAEIIPIYIIGGNTNLFHKSNLHKNYFNWFNSRMTQEEIRKTYANIGKQLINMEQPEMF